MSAATALRRRCETSVSRTQCGILHAAPQSRDRTKHRTVMAGLDPAIHLLRTTLLKRMDARVKPAHDERIVLVTAPALQRIASQELRAAPRPGHEELPRARQLAWRG